MTYRSPSLVPEHDDPEALAIRELSRRATRLRTAIVVPVILLGLLGGGFLYGFLSVVQMERLGGHYVWLTAFGASFRVAPRLADRIVRPALRRWRTELAKAHGLDESVLEETTRVLD
jgi:hypothetical protein